MIIDKLKANGAIAAALLLGALLLTQTVRLHTEQLAHQKLIAATATADAQRADSALKHEIKTSSDESTHAAKTQENSDEFTTSQPVRDAISRADFARVDRLRINAERRAATYRAQAQSNAAACSNLADRHAALDAHIVDGAAVVGALRSDLARRDAEVAMLRKQVDTERALTGGGS